MEALEKALGFSFDFLPVILIVPVFLIPIFIIAMSIYSSAFIRWEKSLRDMAEKSGLTFLNQSDIIVRNPMKAMNLGTYLGMAMRFSLNLSALKLNGTYKNFNINVEFNTVKDSDGECTTMIVNIFFHSPLAFGIIIKSKKSIFNSIKNIIGKNHVSNDTVHDDFINILNAAPEMATTLLNTEESRKALHDLFRVYPSASIDNRGLTIEQAVYLMGDNPWNFKNDIDWIINRMNAFYKTASGL